VKSGGDFKEHLELYIIVRLSYLDLGAEGNRWDRKFSGVFVMGLGVKVLNVSNL